MIGQWKGKIMEGTTSNVVTVSPGSHPNLEVDMKVEDEESVLLPSPPSSEVSVCSTITRQLEPQIYRSTGANGFGQITSKITGVGRPSALRERTNLLPPGSRRPR